MNGWESFWTRMLTEKVRDGQQTLIVGKPGSGKSCLAYRLLCEQEADHTVLLDPKGDLANQYATYCANNGIDFEYDDLASEERILARELFIPQTGGSFGEEVAADRDLEGVIEFLMFRRGFSNVFEHPYIETALRFFSRLLMCQREAADVRKARNALRLTHADSLQLVQGCWHPDVIDLQQEMLSWTKTERERVLHPAQRIIDAVFGNPIVRERICGQYKVLDRPVHIVVGSSLIANEANRAICGFDLIQAILFGMISNDTVQIVVDEAVEFITPWLCRKLETLRSFGVSVTLIVQSPEFSEEIANRTIQACRRKIVFRSEDPTIAEKCARWMLTEVDPYRVHSSETRYQQFHNGFEETTIETRSRRFNGRDNVGESLNEQIRSEPLYRIEKYDIDRYMAIPDQITLLTKEIMSLPTHHFFMVQDGVVSRGVSGIPEAIYPPSFGDLAERRFAKRVAEIQQSDHYRTPEGIYGTRPTTDETAVPPVHDSGDSRPVRGVSDGITKTRKDDQAEEGASGGDGAVRERSSDERVLHEKDQDGQSDARSPSDKVPASAPHSFRRGADVDQRYRADAEFTWNNTKYAIELDTGKVPLKRAIERLQVYRTFDGVVVVVTSDNYRINTMRTQCPQNTLFCLIGQNPLDKIWVDHRGNKRGL